MPQEFRISLTQHQTKELLQKKLKPVKPLFDHSDFLNLFSLCQIEDHYTNGVDRHEEYVVCGNTPGQEGPYAEQVARLLECIHDQSCLVDSADLFEHFRGALASAGFHRLIDEIALLRTPNRRFSVALSFNRCQALPSPPAQDTHPIFTYVSYGRTLEFQNVLVTENIEVMQLKNAKDLTVFSMAFELQKWEIIEILLDHLHCHKKSIDFWMGKFKLLRRNTTVLDHYNFKSNGHKLRLLQLTAQHWENEDDRKSNFVIFQVLVGAGCKVTMVERGLALENKPDTNILFMVSSWRDMSDYFHYVKEYLTKGYGVGGRNVLHYFVQWNCVEIFEALITRPSNYQFSSLTSMVYEKDNSGHTPFTLAISMGRLDCSVLLLDLVKNVPVEVAQVILWKGTDNRSVSGTPTMIEKIDIDVQKTRDDCPGVLKCIQRSWMTADHEERWHTKRTVRRMHAFRCETQGAAIHAACAVGNKRAVEFLLRQGSDGRLGQKEWTEVAVAAGVEKTPFQIALHFGHIGVLETLCEHDSQLIADSFVDGFHPIALAIRRAEQHSSNDHMACCYLKIANFLVKELIKQGHVEDLHLKDSCGLHPLHLISYRDWWSNDEKRTDGFIREALQLTTAILEADRKLVNVEDDDQDIPIHFATAYAFPEMVKMLKQFGSSLETQSYRLLAVVPTDWCCPGGLVDLDHIGCKSRYCRMLFRPSDYLHQMLHNRAGSEQMLAGWQKCYDLLGPPTTPLTVADVHENQPELPVVHLEVGRVIGWAFGWLGRLLNFCVTLFLFPFYGFNLLWL